MKKFSINNLFISLFGIGYIPFASGTFGSIGGVIIGYAINVINFDLFYILIPTLFLLGIIASNKYEKKTGEKDSSIIVIDEVVGQLIAMMFFINDNLLVLLSFLIFRFFDIFKLWPASYIDKNLKGGIGVMLDDVVAGAYTVITIYIIKLVI